MDCFDIKIFLYLQLTGVEKEAYKAEQELRDSIAIFGNMKNCNAFDSPIFFII